MFEELIFRPQEQLPAQPCRPGEGILTLDRLPTLGVGTVPDTRSFFGYLFPQGLLREHLLWPQDLPALHMPLHKHLYWPQGSTDWTASPRPWLSAGSRASHPGARVLDTPERDTHEHVWARSRERLMPRRKMSHRCLKGPCSCGGEGAPWGRLCLSTGVFRIDERAFKMFQAN